MIFVNKKGNGKNLFSLEFDVEPEIFNNHLDFVYHKRIGKLNVQGFRRGKAPRSVVEKIYGADFFFDDALSNLWPEEFKLAIKSAELEDFVAVERVNVIAVSKKDGVKFCVDVVVKPEIELGDYKGIEGKVDPAEDVSDAEVDDTIDLWARKVARIVDLPEGRPCEMGDIVNIDFNGFLDGNEFENGRSENVDLTLGKKTFIDGFEEAVVGHVKGESFKIQLKFPDGYMTAELAGKDVEFEVKINNIKSCELPEINDEFAENISEFGTLKELRADIFKRLKELKERQHKGRTEAFVFAALAAIVTVELPKVMVEQRVDSLVRDLQKEWKRRGLDLENYLQMAKTDEATLRERLGAQAEQQLKLELALEKIATLEQIDVAEDELSAELGRLAQVHGVGREDAEKFWNAGDVKKALLSKKTMDFVLQHAKID
ncbi:MAG: trigger factor [Oscillospiraceae bacterium]|jgi:trigger factor|nr:trigger factor [Oscillospiraceae bacterium]